MDISTNLWTFIPTIVSLGVALFSTLVSLRSVKFAEKSAEATMQTVALFQQELEDNALANNLDLHYKVVHQIRALQAEFPPEIGRQDYKHTPETTRQIFLFWFLIFDEWFACKHEGKYLEGYWERYYKHEIESVLDRVAFREVIVNMIDVKRISFMGLAHEFAKDLELINESISDKKLFQRNLDLEKD